MVSGEKIVGRAVFHLVDKGFQFVVEAMLHPWRGGQRGREGVVAAKVFHGYMGMRNLLPWDAGEGGACRLEGECVDGRHGVYSGAGVDDEFFGGCRP